MNNDLYYIYKYLSPKNQVYVGITNNLERREIQHKTDEKSAVYPLFQKYGEDLKKEVLFVAFGVENAKAVEMEFIEQYDSYYNGYNRTLGGDGILHSRKLSEQQVKEIVELLKDGKLSYRSIGEKYKISDKSIRDISNGKYWTTVTGGKVEKQKAYSKGSNHHNSKLTEVDVIEIKHMLNDQEKLDVIADKFNVKKVTIKQIYLGNNWKEVGPEIIKRSRRKLTQEQIDQVKLLFSQGKGNKEIAEFTGLSLSSVKKIKKM